MKTLKLVGNFTFVHSCSICNVNLFTDVSDFRIKVRVSRVL